MNKSFIATVSVMFFLAASVFASPTGREIADMGKSISVSGILSEEDGEWYIAQGAVTYAIHLGNYEIEAARMYRGLYPKPMLPC